MSHSPERIFSSPVFASKESFPIKIPEKAGLKSAQTSDIC